MGGGLRKPAPEVTYAATTSNKKHPVASAASAKPSDEELDRLEELEAKREEEAELKQKAAVAHVVENLFPYAPVKVQTQKYPLTSPQAGKAYLWISVDEEAIQRRGGGASPVRYPIGVAVDADGNVFVTESGGAATATTSLPQGHSTDIPLTRRITAASIMELAATSSIPSPPLPPRLVLSNQTSLTIRWRLASDSTVDRYEIQSRLADSPNNAWTALSGVLTVRDVTLEGVFCHCPYEFRVRAHNPAGWSEFSTASEIFWTLPGVPETPRSPVVGALTNTYISLFWSPVNANGAAPVVYSLEMRLCGDNHAIKKPNFLPLYEGTSCSFVASGLEAKTSYVFRLQASNTVGSTAFVESKPMRTSAHGRPEIMELTSHEDQSAACDRWVQCWDPKSEQVFFFNKYTCQRVTDEPRELVEARQKHGLQTVEETPEMLFRRKRFRFHRELRQTLHGVNLSATYTLALRRESMYEDTQSCFAKMTKVDAFAKPKITFANEAGIDSGGLTKDWYLQVSKHAVANDRRLFQSCDRGQYEIDSASSSRLHDFQFLGRFMAKAIFDRQTLDLPLCDAVLRHILQLPLTMADLHDMDPQFHKSLVWMLENDIAGVIDETFSVDAATASGHLSIVDLMENGRDVPVTNLNKAEYVQLMLQWRTEFGIKTQLDALLHGFSTVIPLPSIHVFDLSELRMLLNGKPTIDVEELRANTVFQGGYSEHAQVVLWLWQALRDFCHEMRGQFLKFMTGTNKVPLDGFEPPLNLTKSDLDPAALPRTHTCFNQLVLPEYQSYETLVDKVTYAITNADGFELS